MPINFTGMFQRDTICMFGNIKLNFKILLMTVAFDPDGM